MSAGMTSTSATSSSSSALNRNASAHTVRAYKSDLTQFLGHAAAREGVAVSDVPA